MLINREKLGHRQVSPISTRQLACLVLLIAFCVWPIKTATADHFHCYLLAGQSNMDGRGENSDLTDAQIDSVKDVIIYYNNPPLTTDGWVPLKPGFSRPPKYKAQLPSPKFGPEIGFAAEMLQSAQEQKIAIIKASEGGTNLRLDWQPGVAEDPASQGPNYRNFIQTIKRATDQLTKEGHTYEIRAMLWHQGESDSKAAPKTHQKRLTNLIARVRNDCEVPELPVVLGQVFDNGKRDKVRTAIKATSEAVDKVGLVTAEGLTTWDAGTHFDAASQITLGQRFAKETMSLLGGQKQAAKKKIVCFGDSITNRGYPTLLGKLLNADAINAGVGGHTSRQGLHRIKKDVLQHRPDVVVILFGTNDIRVDSQKHVAIDEYQKNLNQMIAACKNVDAELVLCTLPPINSKPYFTRHQLSDFDKAGGLETLVKDYCEAAATVSRQTQVPLVDFQTLLKVTPEWMAADGVHPTTEGNQIIAQHIADAVEELLSAD
ncbi:MAG: sialate O-acetylesterase [Fuerstiella sp.]